MCYCNQCRAAEVFLDQPDPKSNGVALFQTTADRIRFLCGADKMYAFSFAQGGLIHWYARCCKVPLFNTTATPQSGFASVLVDRIPHKDPLGPIRAEIFRDNGKGRQVHHGLPYLIWTGSTRALRMRVTGRWKMSPFFGKSGAPISRVHVLSDVEKGHLQVAT